MKHSEKAIFFWSGGKDSALCLHKILEEGKYEITALVSTISADLKRVSMHGVREELIEEQAKNIRLKDGSTGIFFHKMYINSHSTNELYEASLERILLHYKLQGIHKVIFGDIFLEDLRAYRENILKKFDMHGVYPLWQLPTGVLINEFLDLGFKTRICCCDSRLLGEHILGKVIDEELIKSFPPEIDPCGENGEFHTFTFAGPVFSKEIGLKLGESVLKVYELESGKKQEHGFWFIDMQLEF
jgi:uncharacterized protein (TIGR00290 family)